MYAQSLALGTWYKHGNIRDRRFQETCLCCRSWMSFPTCEGTCKDEVSVQQPLRESSSSFYATYEQKRRIHNAKACSSPCATRIQLAHR